MLGQQQTEVRALRRASRRAEDTTYRAWCAFGLFATDPSYEAASGGKGNVTPDHEIPWFQVPAPHTVPAVEVRTVEGYIQDH